MMDALEAREVAAWGKHALGENPKVSVIMGIYNCAETLPTAIDSILAQTYTNWELIMCNDASSDNTYEVAAEYQRRYPDKIILIQNETNSYLAYSLNHCLQHATGELVARMDGDDISLPERFEKQVAYLREHPEVDLVGTAMQRFSEEGGLADVMMPRAKPDRWSLRYGPCFMHATIMTYKRVYDDLGGYTVGERTRRCEDYDLWFRFFARGFEGHSIREPLYLVREDMNAIKRRTAESRWNAFKTTRMGYEMLGYPKSWLVRDFAYTIGKSLVPSVVVVLYRKYQAR